MRRCLNGSCELKANKLTRLDLPVATIMTNPKVEWARMASAYGASRVARSIETDWNVYTPDKYLFSHASIVSSVATEADGHTIVPCCSDLINKNANAWTNPVLLATFKSFIGGHNWVEHNQVVSDSRGRILDVIIRPITYENDLGSADVYFVDILIGTHRRHVQLVSEIENGEYDSLSMGCLAAKVQCSKCGKVFSDNDESCSHIQKELLTEYHKNGKAHTVAELCGSSTLVDGVWVGDPSSCQFIEASWVRRPAFQGAVLNHFVIPQKEQFMAADKIASARTGWLDDVCENLFQLRVADAGGMMMLRLAREELMRRKRMAMIERLSR